VAVLEIPDPSLVVLIGAAGAGKTTFAARHFGPHEILSSDRYRALLGGDEGNQSVTRAAFGRLHRDLARRLGDGHLTVVDATNVERTARRSLLQRSRVAGLEAVAIVLDLPATTVLARNAGRAGRVVNDAVVQRHLGRLRATVDGPEPNGAAAGLLAEGFAAVVLLRDPTDVDSLSIVRVPRRRPPERTDRP
jgi:protein phosphatase